MTDGDLLTTVTQISGTIIGMTIKSTLQSIPGVMGIIAGAPITVLTAGIGGAATLLSAAILVGIFK
jgi:Fe2+ transport system protein FeoA